MSPRRSRSLRESARPRGRSRVPQSPLERLGRIGWLAGETAALGLLDHARRRVTGATATSLSSSLLSSRNAERLARRLSTMRGAAMKLGQLLSLEGDDFLPAEFVEALAILRDQGDAMPDAQLERVLSEDLSPGWAGLFADFEMDPIAAASIGQVHRARLADGSRLALKIQYPGIARSIGSDVDNLVSVLRWSRLLPADVDLTMLATEAKRQLRQEADYLTEARHLDHYRNLLRDELQVVVPRVHAEHTTRRILAMDYLPGVPLEDLCGPRHSQETRDRVGGILYRLMLRELFELRFVQSDPNFANFLWLPEEDKVGLIDLGGAHEVSPQLAGRYLSMLRAGRDRRTEDLRCLARQIGFVNDEDRPEQVDGVASLLELSCEPFRSQGRYDFGRSDLPVRLREKAIDLAFVRGFRRPPPAETLFIHRKLAGTFLLCSRLRCRIDLAPMTRELLNA